MPKKLYRVPCIGQVRGQAYDVYIDPAGVNQVYKTTMTVENRKKNTKDTEDISVTSFYADQHCYVTGLTVKELLRLLEITIVEPPANV